MVEEKISIGYLQQIDRIIISFPGQGSTEIKSEDLLEYAGECTSGLEQVQYMLDFGFAKDKDVSRTEEPTIHFLLESSSDRTTDNALKSEFRDILSRVCKYSIAIKIKICDWDNFSDLSAPILVLNAGKKTIHKTLDEAYASSASREYILEGDIYQEFRIFLLDTARGLSSVGSIRITMAEILYAILVNDAADVVQDEIFMTFKLFEGASRKGQQSELSESSPSVKLSFKLFNAAKLLFGIQEFMPLGRSKGSRIQHEMRSYERKRLKVNVIQCCNQPMLMSKEALLHCRAHIGNECTLETQRQPSSRNKTIWNETFVQDVNSNERVLIQVIQSNSNGNVLILGEAAFDVSQVSKIGKPLLAKFEFDPASGQYPQQEQEIGLKLFGVNGMELKSKEKLCSYLDLSVSTDTVPSPTRTGLREECTHSADFTSPKNGILHSEGVNHDVVLDMSIIACKNIPLVPFGSKVYVEIECGDDRKYTKSRIYREEMLFNETFRFLLKNDSAHILVKIVCKPQNNVHYEIGKVLMEKSVVSEMLQAKQELHGSQQHTFSQSVIRESNQNLKERSIMLLGHQYPAWRAFEVRNAQDEPVLGETAEHTQVLINLAAHNRESELLAGSRVSSPKDTPVVVNVTFAEDIVPFVLDPDLLNGWKLEVLLTVAQVLNEPKDRFEIASVSITDCINVRLLIRPLLLLRSSLDDVAGQARQPSSQLRQIHPTISDCEMIGDFNHFQIDDFVTSHDLLDSDTSHTIEHDSSSVSSALGLVEFEESRIEPDEKRNSLVQRLKSLAEICKQNRESRSETMRCRHSSDMTASGYERRSFLSGVITATQGPREGPDRRKDENDVEYEDGQSCEASKWMMAKCTECKIFKRRERLNSNGKCPRCARNTS
eukprot:759717-Hanusia_phi.AAC.3